MPTGKEVNNDQFRNHRMSVQGLASEIGTVPAAAGAATLNDLMGIVTTEALTTAQNAKYTLTLTNSKIAVGDMVHVTIGNGTNSAGTPLLQTVTEAAGSVVIVVANKHDTAVALNGSLVVKFMVVKKLQGL